MSQSNAKIERNGELHSVPIAEVQEQDILLLESGNQICADAVVTDGSIEVNESLLTGESDAVYKRQAISLLSGVLLSAAPAVPLSSVWAVTAMPPS